MYIQFFIIICESLWNNFYIPLQREIPSLLIVQMLVAKKQESALKKEMKKV